MRCWCLFSARVCLVGVVGGRRRALGHCFRGVKSSSGPKVVYGAVDSFILCPACRYFRAKRALVRARYEVECEQGSKRLDRKERGCWSLAKGSLSLSEHHYVLWCCTDIRPSVVD